MSGIHRSRLTGLILAGGEGKRMGGVDKGLLPFEGKPLVQHVLERLSPQVGRVMISANRNLDAYRQLGLPVWADGGKPGRHDGPLAGMLAGLQHCETSWLVSVPCDCPRFPMDLVQRLMESMLDVDAEIAIAATEENDGTRWQPVFCAMSTKACLPLQRYLLEGGRGVARFMATRPHTVVRFEAASAFLNLNGPGST